jgi:hypothetical protein
VKKYWETLRPFEKRVVVGVATMVFVIINLWFVVPRFSDWGKMKIRMSDARRTLAAFQVQIDQIPTYKVGITNFMSEGMEVPREDQASQFGHTIVNEGIRVGISANIGRVSVNTNDPFFLEQSVQVPIQMVKEQELVDFLYNLGASNSLITVRDLALRPADQNRYQLNANIKLVASYQKNPAKRTAPVAPTNQPARPFIAGSKQPTPTIRTVTPTNKAPTKTSVQTNKPPNVPGKKTTKP